MAIYIKEQEMQKESKSYGAVYEVDAETMKAFDIATVRARMEACKEAESPAWEAICRLAGREIDFEVDDLMALEKRAQAEFKRARADYGGEGEFARKTASPILGNLNSGLQVYAASFQAFWPEVFKALHFPNYLASLFTGKLFSEITSIGCHTALWDFDEGQYHPWVSVIEDKLAPISAQTSLEIDGIHYGLGLHDSSAALVPYLRSMSADFVLLSTGTWCIAMHPFNESPLTAYELANDVLCYLQPNGKAVKSSRLFGGHFHDEQVARMEGHFGGSFQDLQFSERIFSLSSSFSTVFESGFSARDLNDFSDLASAYDQFMVDLVGQQIFSLNLLFKDAPVKQLLVDGGFSKNEWYMRLLAHAFPAMEIYAAEVAQASALGAALLVYQGDVPNNLIQLKRY